MINHYIFLEIYSLKNVLANTIYNFNIFYIKKYNLNYIIKIFYLFILYIAVYMYEVTH